MKAIGVVSDTHGMFDASLKQLFSGVDCILHAGDICAESVINELETIAPVMAIRGNCDEGLATEDYPEWLTETLGGYRFLMLHDLGKPERPHSSVQALIERHKPEIVISGHTHSGRIACFAGRLYLNPGSAGKKRFRLERSAAVIELLSGDQLRLTLHSLEAHAPMETLTFHRASDPPHSFLGANTEHLR